MKSKLLGEEEKCDRDDCCDCSHWCDKDGNHCHGQCVSDGGDVCAGCSEKENDRLDMEFEHDRAIGRGRL